MALKIIGAGFGRTGTMSTYQALNQLGFPCYHMAEVTKNPPHLNFWLKVADAPAGTQQDWDEVFADYVAAVDHPACDVWRELMAAYPDAKVILTLHPKGAEAWYASTMETIYFTEDAWQFSVMAAVIPATRRFKEMVHKLVWQRAHKGAMKDRATVIAQYNDHIREVQAAVPADRLLTYSVDQGWEPLCGFLGVPVPATPFPRVNDRADFKKNMARANKVAYSVLALGGLIAMGLGYMAVRFLG
ncbi:MAG: hypothetical protein EPO08_03590 [Rhodospirillaceae bacterium]|nr:MAG: hypothetical protein EPO08_03590 [Rhodospirillaceae bacterium]